MLKKIPNHQPSDRPVEQLAAICKTASELVLSVLLERKRELQLNIQGPHRWKVVLIALFILLLVAEVDLLIRQERSYKTSARAEKVAGELIDFAQARGDLARRRADESIRQYEGRISKENATTQSLYSDRYYQEVAYLRQEFARRGLSDSELEALYRRPGCAIAVREVGKALFAMGATLHSRTFF